MTQLTRRIRRLPVTIKTPEEAWYCVRHQALHVEPGRRVWEDDRGLRVMLVDSGSGPCVEIGGSVNDGVSVVALIGRMMADVSGVYRWDEIAHRWTSDNAADAAAWERLRQLCIRAAELS